MTRFVCMAPFLARCVPHCLSDILATANDTRLFKSSTLANTSAAYAETLVALSTTLTYDLIARKNSLSRSWASRDDVNV
ncbi:hypothetical protein EDB19DRAFT_1748795 [Suillus lakei]|nr:hypothetical protein EDB19DRAFT_1748795 [Suillus lakei]